MADEPGQAAADPGSTGTTAPAAPTASAGVEQTTSPTTGAPAAPTPEGRPAPASSDESFFDPRDLDPNLLPAYKQMQAAFTKKQQALAADREKVEAYNQLLANPRDTIARLAQQYGVMPQQQQGQQGDPNAEWTPQDWEEVREVAAAEAEQRILKRLEPVLGKVRDLQKGQIESELDSKYPDWRTYESEMVELMREHPTFANPKYIDQLYSMALPEDVKRARAYKDALAKMRRDGDGGQVSGPTTTRQTTSRPQGPMTLTQAVEAAKATLAERGLRP